LRAAKHAVDRSANAEAVVNAERGLQALSKLPESSDRYDLELELQIALGSAMVAAKCYADPAVESAEIKFRS
jgi:hypothetical protein